MKSATLKNLLPYLALAYGILSLSMSGIFVRWAHAPGPVTSFYRMAFGTLALAPVIGLHVRRWGVPRMAWLVFPLLGGAFTALDHAAWATSIGYTRIANATLLNYIAPVWVAVFAALVWRERLSKIFWAGLLVTLLGMAVVVGSDLLFSPSMNLGNLLAVISSLFYAGYFLVAQRGRTRLDPLTYVWVSNLSSGVVLLAVNLVLGHPLSGFDSTTWLIFGVAAIFLQVGAYFTLAYALGHLPASVVSATMVGQPVLTSLLAVVLAGEMMAAGQWLGGLAVVVGIYLVNMRRGKPV